MVRTPWPLVAAASGWRISLKAEFLLVLGLVALLLAVNLATAEIYPMVWVDEAGYTDPGINLAHGNGLTSSAWPNVYWGKFWYSFPPLYPLLIALWVTLFGVNLTVIRLFNVVLISATAIALWRYTVRSGLFPRLLGRMAIVLLPLLGYGVSFSYRNARPDTLCALLAALALNASILADRRWRAASLFAIGALMAWTGPQIAAFAVILGLLVGVWWPRDAVGVFLPLGAGIGVGLIGLLGFYAVEGGLYGFLTSTFGSVNSITGQIAQVLLLHDPRGAQHLQRLPALLLAVVVEDRSSTFLSAAAVLLLFALRRARDTIAFKASRFAVTAAFGIPILTALAGQYWLNYTWTGLLTVGIAVVVSLEMSPPSLTSLPARRLAIGCVGLALLVGLPLQLPRAYLQRDARDYDALRAFVQTRVAPGDWVYLAPQAYFAAAELGAVPVTDEYAKGRLAPGIPADQRERIKLFIVHPNEVGTAIERLGGSWKPSGPEFSPPGATRLTWGEWDARDAAYHLVAYRRE